MKLIRESRSIRSKSCPIVTLSNKIPTWTGLELNLCVRAERLATNCLNYDAAPIYLIFTKIYSYNCIYRSNDVDWMLLQIWECEPPDTTRGGLSLLEKDFYPAETVSGAILEGHLNGNSKSLPVKSDRLRYGDAVRNIRAVRSHTHYPVREVVFLNWRPALG
jgi:hypothetical protein